MGCLAMWRKSECVDSVRLVSSDGKSLKEHVLVSTC